MRIGLVILPQGRWTQDAQRWRRAEAYGFDSAWTYDHLAWRSLADEPWFATVPTLAAAAGVTSTIRLGTWVASPNFRHPVPFAKELMSLDDLSGGRFTLGVGAGGAGFDATVLGGALPSPGRRAARLAEFVELLDQLLTRERTSWRGEFYEAVDARMYPGCVQQPRLPFVVAANGPKAMAVAARFGSGWATTGGSEETEDAWWAGVGRLVERLEEVEAAAGRDVALTRHLNLDSGPAYALRSRAAVHDAVGRARELGFDEVLLHWPRREGAYAGSEAVLDEVADDLPGLRGGQ